MDDTDGTTMEPRRHLDGVAMEPKTAPSPGVAARGDALAVVRCQDYIASMDTVPRPNDGTPATPSETEAEQQRRLAWEAEGIAEARADVAAGRLVDGAKVRAWVDSLRTDNPLPVPYSGR